MRTVHSPKEADNEQHAKDDEVAVLFHLAMLKYLRLRSSIPLRHTRCDKISGNESAPCTRLSSFTSKSVNLCVRGIFIAPLPMAFQAAQESAKLSPLAS